MTGDKITMAELTPQEEQKLKELAVNYFEETLGLPPAPSSADVIEGMQEARIAEIGGKTESPMTTEQERIAELKRDLRDAKIVGIPSHIQKIDSELSRLCNEGGDSKTEEGRGAWRLVPVTPTEEMLVGAAGNDPWLREKARENWDDMLKHAPGLEAGRGEREGLETRKAISRRLDEFTRQAQEAHVDTNGADRDRSRWTFKNWRCIDVDELIELAGKALDLAPANRK